MYKKFFNGPLTFRGVYCGFEGLPLRGTWRFVVRGIHAVLIAVQYTHSFMSQMCKKNVVVFSQQLHNKSFELTQVIYLLEDPLTVS